MRLQSGHREATMRYAHHMGSCEYMPAIGWAQYADHPDTRCELSGYQYPDLDAAALEAKCRAIVNNRKYGKFGVRR